MAINGADGILGINGLGRIGKLTLWHEAGNQRFERLVVNTGREVGMGLDAIVRYLSSDSTYGSDDSALCGAVPLAWVDRIHFRTEEEKQRFAIREGGRTIGAGVISKIIE